MKLWDEARVQALERQVTKMEAALQGTMREIQGLRERLAESKGAFEMAMQQLRRLESEVDALSRPQDPAAFTGMESARAALENAGDDPARELSGFERRHDEFWGGGLSVEEMIQRGAMVAGREFPEEEPDGE